MSTGLLEIEKTCFKIARLNGSPLSSKRKEIAMPAKKKAAKKAPAKKTTKKSK
jgi:hypothetical protein